ncbi:uncharacterized protein LOC122274613 [Carya illinoinensis]|uniref:uncharacterized protein LOC122274613 n=1 Tax=Carya illinoinensis TaxID=32201 RepID=UPI001C726381|nr:uncharacterized protein LOC122274613 [Carya illinoinensis]
MGNENPILRTQDSLLTCKTRLQVWSKLKGGGKNRTLQQKRILLKELQLLNKGDLNNEIKGLQSEVDVMLEEEEIKWRQRSKQLWLKEGDKNSKYFHKCATQRRQWNEIKVIENESGKKARSQEDISLLFQDYYQNLFESSNPRNIEDVLRDIEPGVTDEMNRQLVKECSLAEVKQAVFEMNPMSAPSLDGFSAGFYQDNWQCVGVGVFLAVKEVLSGGRDLGRINETFIVLIPKKKKPVFFSKYKPISLCNVLYKIVSKVLANRLKKILPLLISPSQSAFVPGRLISNNIIVAYEAMHSMQYRMRGKKEGYMAVKLDMSKAYDRIEWDFLAAVLRRMGFKEKWVGLIKACVETVRYSLMINRIPQQPFHPTRGLRQGDPLSPYLFILCSEILGRMLNKAEEKGYISDDSLLFCKVNALEWSRLYSLLSQYESASGQRLNLEKTAVYFSRNTRIEAKDAILSGVRLCEARSYEKYLGLPSYAKVGSNASFLWRSFLEARPILQEGLFWRIGNGDFVNIWTEKWLPRPSSFKVQSPLKAEFAASKVSTLIDSSSGAWKMDTLREVFRHEEVEVVCRIPVSMSNSQDKLIWRCAKDGRFTVRSAYYLAGEMSAEQKGQTSQARQKSELWSKLWKLMVPSATRMLLWRACHDSLPTNQKLVQRKIIESPLCPICETELESKLKVSEVPFKELCKDMFDVLDDHSITVFAETIYMIWRRRNSFVFENRFMDPNELVKAANQKVKDYQEANQTSGGKRVATTLSQSYWSAPPDQFYKANWDASVDRVKSRIGIGVIIRDWNGVVVATLRHQRESFPDPVVAEALGALKAVSLCQQFLLDRVILEGDAKVVVDDINCDTVKWNSGGMIIQDIKHKLSSMGEWSVQFIPRNINTIAHILAKDALKLSEESIVMGGIPSCIQASML